MMWDRATCGSPATGLQAAQAHPVRRRRRAGDHRARLHPRWQDDRLRARPGGERARRHSESALNVEGETQAVWVVSFAGGAPRKIGEGHSPAISSSGRIAYVKGGQIWAASLADTLAAVQLMHTRGSPSELRWSPRGDKLAFTSDRGDHGFIGVYDATAKTLAYLSPSVDVDGSPIWSPDGARVAFVRIVTTSRRPVFGADRTEEPWSIVVADVATGNGHEIWKAKPGVGSAFRGIVADAQLMWGAGRSHRLSVGARRLDASLRGERGRRRRLTAHARRLRGRARVARRRTARVFCTRRTRATSTGGTSGASA